MGNDVMVFPVTRSQPICTALTVLRATCQPAPSTTIIKTPSEGIYFGRMCLRIVRMLF